MNNKQYEEQEEEEFFESFDRIQSSSASGSETEEEEEEEEGVRHRITSTLSQKYANQPCQFPMATISMYDVWISEPGSIKERRKRLLQELGLSNDRALSRLTSISDTRRDIVVSSSSAADNPDECSTSGTSIVGLSCDADGKGDLGRSFSYNEFLPRRQQHVEDGGAMVRSRSDGTSVATSCCHDDGHHLCNFSFPPPPQSSISTQQCFLHNKLSPSTSKQELNTSLSTTTTTTAAATTLANNIIIHNKPPTGKTHCPPQHISHHRQASSGKSSQGFDEIDYLKNGALNPSSILDDNVNFFREKLLNCDASNNEFHDHESGVCTIKNLDNGKEFVVNEIREDGMWNKLREVETGRQLTMEEFEMCVGHSPIVQELMRRENVEDFGNQKKDKADLNGNLGLKAKKKGNWFKSIKFVANTMAGHRERRSSDERETSSEKGGRRSSSATDDSQDVLPFQTPERIKVRQYGKSCKELTALYMSQEIQAHKGSIWSIKFSLDGRYLASAGEDRVIHVWQVLMESEKDGNVMNPPFLSPSPSPESTLVSSSSNMDNNLEKKKRGKISCSNKRYANPDHVRLPEHMFSLSEKPICSFLGHLADVFDLSWSKSQLLLSSSMDKTVRLWHMSSNSCLKMFSHSDYVTCIQFNPVDDRYFISGSLDAKVRIWSILDRQVVDWSDLHEMVTAACYTPDGQGALVGSHKGSCRLYNTSGNKLNQESQINLQSKKKKSHVKKITGFQFAPGNSSEVLITSADSRIRVFDGVDLVHKFKGFRNTSSQITASLTANGKYVISASEDSYVYVWRYDGDSHIGRRSKGVTTITRSYEHFHCRDVSAAIPWPGLSIEKGSADGYCDPTNQICRAKTSIATASPLVQEPDIHHGIAASCDYATSPLHSFSGTDNNFFSDRVSATWPEEKLLATINKRSPRSNELCSNGNVQERPAWGLVIVTAGLGGKIKTFQNFGLPVRI